MATYNIPTGGRRDFTANNIIDGENTGEVMTPGYSDANAPTNSGGDIIDGADGINDVILGNGGDDTIDAGLGDDEVYGGSGDDTIDGGEGNDTIVGDYANGVRDIVVDQPDGTIIEVDRDPSLSVTINSQAGGYNGNLLAEITSTDGSVRVATLTTNYDGNIGNTFSVDLEAGDVVRVGITTNAGFTVWSNTSEVISTSRGPGLAKLNFEDDGGTDYDDLVVTADLVGDASLAVNGGTLPGFSGEGVSVTINSQAGAFNGSLFAEITSPDGSVRVETLTGNYDANVGNTYSFDLAEGETYRFGMTANGSTIWSNSTAAYETALNNGSVRINFEDDGDYDYDDLVVTYTERSSFDRIPVTNNGDLSFDDTINGGNGDDVIYGDNAESVAPTEEGFTGPRESFNWQSLSQTQADSSVSQNTGSVNVTYREVSENGHHESTIANNTYVNVSGIDSGNEAIDTNSSLLAQGGGGYGDSATYQWAFDEPVGNLEFNISDLDQASVVSVTAYGLDGTEIPVTLLTGSSVARDGNLLWSTSGNREAWANENNVQVSIAGPVSRIEVSHTQLGAGAPGVYITDMFFDTGYQPASDGGNGEGGDDVITGGLGADQMYGEGGDDTFIVGSAQEGAGDVIVGGNGPDRTTDNDTLDLRGAGAVTIDAIEDATDAGALTGTVTFGDGSTLAFSQIETILQDAPELTITPAPDQPTDAEGRPLTIENGDPATIVITRSGPTDEPLVVTLNSDDTSEGTVPQTVTIPAGQSSVTVDVTPVDDTDVDGTQYPVITANADGFDPVTTVVAVDDDDVPGPVVCYFEVPTGTPVDSNGFPTTIENGDPITVTFTREGPTDEPLTVTLTSDDTTEATVPQTLTIPAGQSSVDFLVTPVDDTLIDGPQFPKITATGPNLVAPVEGFVRVDDDDVEAPVLTIAPGPDQPTDAEGRPLTVENGDPATIVITRSGPTNEPLVVTLNSDDTSEGTVPQTVTIPAGQSSVTVDVTPVDDTDIDGTQYPVITADADGFDPVTTVVAVDDDDDCIVGTECDDIISDDSGWNHVDGGDGYDVLKLKGVPEDYSFEFDGDHQIILIHEDGTTHALHNMEAVSVDGQEYSIQDVIDFAKSLGGDDSFPTDGDDVIEAPDSGCYTIDGKDGNDTLVLDGEVGDYQLYFDGGTHDVIISGEGAQSYALSNIENVEVNGETFSIEDVIAYANEIGATDLGADATNAWNVYGSDDHVSH